MSLLKTPSQNIFQTDKPLAYNLQNSTHNYPLALSFSVSVDAILSLGKTTSSASGNISNRSSFVTFSVS